jgi:hypothetical protein
MVLQVVAIVQIYTEKEIKKNLKAKLYLSDGNNRILAFIFEKVYNNLVIKFSA